MSEPDNPPASVPPAPQPLSEVLLEILRSDPPPGGMTLNTIFHWTEGRGIFLFVVVLCLPFLSGLAPPGLSTPFGTVVLWLGVREALGKSQFLPFRLGERVLPTGFQKVLRASIKVLHFLEKWLVRPRRTIWMNWSSARFLNGCLLASMALLLALPLPFPLTNMLPAYAIVLLAMSMMEGDGFLIWVGYVVSAGALVFFIALADLIANFLFKYFSQAVNWIQSWL